LKTYYSKGKAFCSLQQKQARTRVQLPEQRGVNDPNLLRILIEINQWEDNQGREFQTVSGRDLYFKIAATLLDGSTDKKQPLKLLSGRITDRATRNRIREFQELGFVEVVQSDLDTRSKRVVPTDKFVTRLNLHLYLFKQLCDLRYLMVEKT
jgi:hypothetical protein